MFRAMERVKGRGAQSGDVSTRFGLATHEADGDWRDVTEEFPRTILSFNQSPDIGFDRSVNAYRGCEHGCIYCFARPTHAYLDLSPGLDFESKLFAKPDAAQLLAETLAKPGYQARPIAMGTNTDPYQPIEGRYRITRAMLEVCLDARHPVTITTKSDRGGDFGHLARPEPVASGRTARALPHQTARGVGRVDAGRGADPLLDRAGHPRDHR